MNHLVKIYFHPDDAYEDHHFECNVVKEERPIGKFFAEVGETPKKSYIIQTEKVDEPFTGMEIYPDNVELYESHIKVTGFRVIYKLGSPPVLIPIKLNIYPSRANQNK